MKKWMFVKQGTMKNLLEILKREELVSDKLTQEKEEKLKIAEIERLRNNRDNLVDKIHNAREGEIREGEIREGERRTIELQIQQLDQKINSNDVHLEKIRSHIKILNNLIFIIDNKEILKSKGVVQRLEKLPKRRLDTLLEKINLDNISIDELEKMITKMEYDYKTLEKFEVILGTVIGMMTPKVVMHGIQKFGILLRMIRPQGMISPLCACFAGIYLANKGFPTYIDIILAFSLIILLWFGGIILNDYFDYEVDAITEPDRLIPSGKISRDQVLYSSIFLMLAAFIITIIKLSIKLSIIIGIMIFLIILYNARLKKMGLLGSFSFGAIEGLSFLIGVYIIGTINIASALIFISIIFLHASVNMIGAVKDIEGDRQTGNWTVPAKYGIDFTLKLTIMLLLLSSAIVYIPIKLGLLNFRYMPIVIAITLWLVIITIMLKSESKLGYMALAMFDMGASIYYISLITGV